MGAFQQVGEGGCLVCPPKLRSSGPGLPLPRIRPIVISHTKCRHPDIRVGPGPPFKLPRPRSQRSVKSLRHASSSILRSDVEDLRVEQEEPPLITPPKGQHLPM